MSVVYSVEAIKTALNDSRFQVTVTSTGGFHCRWADIKNVENDFVKVAAQVDAVRRLQQLGYAISTEGPQAQCDYKATSKNQTTGQWGFYPHWFVNDPAKARGRGGVPASNVADAVTAAIAAGWTPDQVKDIVASMGGGAPAAAPAAPAPAPTAPTAETPTPTDVPAGNGESDGVEDEVPEIPV